MAVDEMERMTDAMIFTLLGHFTRAMGDRVVTRVLFQLPHDLLRHLMQWLDIQDVTRVRSLTRGTRARLPLTWFQFQQLVIDEYTMPDHFIQALVHAGQVTQRLTWRADAQTPTLNVLAQRFPRLQQLDLLGEGIAIPDPHALEAWFAKLTHLTLHSFVGGRNILIRLVQLLTALGDSVNLSHLDVRGTRDATSVMSVAPRTLTHLGLAPIRLLSENHFATLLKRCPALTAIDWGVDDLDMSPTTWQLAATRNWTSVRLNLRQWGGDPAALVLPFAGPRLTTFHVQREHKGEVSAQSFWQPLLTRLDGRVCREVQLGMLSAPAKEQTTVMMLCIQRLPNLTLWQRSDAEQPPAPLWTVDESWFAAAYRQAWPLALPNRCLKALHWIVCTTPFGDATLEALIHPVDGRRDHIRTIDARDPNRIRKDGMSACWRSWTPKHWQTLLEHATGLRAVFLKTVVWEQPLVQSVFVALVKQCNWLERLELAVPCVLDGNTLGLLLGKSSMKRVWLGVIPYYNYSERGKHGIDTRVPLSELTDLDWKAITSFVSRGGICHMRHGIVPRDVTIETMLGDWLNTQEPKIRSDWRFSCIVTKPAAVAMWKRNPKMHEHFAWRYRDSFPSDINSFPSDMHTVSVDQTPEHQLVVLGF